MNHKPWIESILSELDFVEWDRYYSFGQSLAFYGWIDRDKDDYKDFVVVILDNENRLIRGFHTSSAKYSEKIGETLDINHSPCQRVEDNLSIDNIIELGDAEDILEGRTSDVETIKSTLSLQYSTAQDLFTDERMRILEALSRKEFDSISELSEELRRDKRQVSKDIKALYETAIIDLEESEVTEEDGRSLKPVFNLDQIRIQPLTFNEEVEDE